MDEREFSCRDMLGIPQLREARLLGGAEGLETPVTRVNVMEVPDVVQWVRPGEFLITTGYPFRDRPEALLELIPQLASRGVAAIGIKTKRFVDQIPAEAAKIADRCRLPLIELPPATAFSDVVREVMERVLMREAEQIGELQNRFYRISQSLLAQGGIESFLDSLETMLGNPVAIVGIGGEALLSSEWIRLHATAHDWAGFRRQVRAGVGLFELNGRNTRIYAAKVPIRHLREAILLLLEWNREFSVLDTLTVERVAVLAGMELNNRNARQEVEFKYVDQFLQDWLTGRIVTQADIRLRAEACGSPLGEYGACFAAVVAWKEEEPDKRKLDGMLKELRFPQSTDPAWLSFTIIDGHLWMIGGLNEGYGEFRLELPARAALVRRLRMAIDAPFIVCFGPPVSTPEQVTLCWRKAEFARKTALRFGFSGDVVEYADLGVYALLQLLPDGPELEEFRSRYLTPLVEYDRQNDTSLLSTLRIYYQHNGNARKTADALFTHYNTVIYRLDRVRAILGLDLDHADERLQLQIALKLHDLHNG